MKLRIFVCLFICVFLSGGCCFFKRKSLQKSEKAYVQSGRLIQKSWFHKDGKLLIMPFEPGAGVTADPHTEKIGLLIVQGISEEIMSGESSVEILGASDHHTAEWVLKGRITGMQLSPKWKSFIFRKDRKSLGIEGEVINAQDGRLIMKFSHVLADKKRGETIDGLASKLGRDIGRFFLSTVN